MFVLYKFEVIQEKVNNGIKGCKYYNVLYTSSINKYSIRRTERNIKYTVGIVCR